MTKILKEMKKRTSKTPSEQLQDELEPILQWEDEGGYQPPMEYDESDDIEDAKNAIERKLISFVAVEKINALKIYNIEEIEADEKNKWVIYTLPKKERHIYRLVLDTICFGFLSKFTEENKLNGIDSAYLLLIHYLHGAVECELDVAKQRTITVQTKLEENGLGIMERIFRLGREGFIRSCPFRHCSLLYLFSLLSRIKPLIAALSKVSPRISSPFSASIASYFLTAE